MFHVSRFYTEDSIVDMSEIMTSQENEPSDAEEEPFSPPPPDGGWGWVVVFASFMCILVTGKS